MAILEKGDGGVLIDEVDLHLHPAWQQKVLNNLTDIFPNVQFIVTTHAPSVINSVKKENIRMLSDGEVVETDNQVYGKDINSVLKEIMQVDERPENFIMLFDEFYKYLSENKYLEAEKILDKLEQMRGSHVPEIARCRVKLKLENIRRKS